MKANPNNSKKQEEVKGDRQHIKPRAVCYLRSATAPQRRPASVLDTQRARCDATAQALGARVVASYEDAGKSAHELTRPGLQALLARLKRRPQIDYVITPDRSRLSRNILIDTKLSAEIEQSGARLVTTHNDHRPMTEAMSAEGVSAAEQFVTCLVQIISEFEHRERSARAKAAWQARKS